MPFETQNGHVSTRLRPILNFLKIVNKSEICFNFNMASREITDNQDSIENLNKEKFKKKPIKEVSNGVNRVDINVLKSKLQKTQDKEFKRNLIFISLLLVAMISLGIFLSL